MPLATEQSVLRVSGHLDVRRGTSTYSRSTSAPWATEQHTVAPLQRNRLGRVYPIHESLRTILPDHPVFDRGPLPLCGQIGEGFGDDVGDGASGLVGVGGDQADAGAAVEDVVDAEGALVADGELISARVTSMPGRRGRTGRRPGTIEDGGGFEP